MKVPSTFGFGSFIIGTMANQLCGISSIDGLSTSDNVVGVVDYDLRVLCSEFNSTINAHCIFMMIDVSFGVVITANFREHHSLNCGVSLSVLGKTDTRNGLAQWAQTIPH